jgi:hypothetical protein
LRYWNNDLKIAPMLYFINIIIIIKFISKSYIYIIVYSSNKNSYNKEINIKNNMMNLYKIKINFYNNYYI